MGRRPSILIFCASWLLAALAFAQENSGEALYQQYCSSCHNDPVDRAPSRLALSDYNPNAIVHALSAGIMRTQAAALTEDQRILLAEYLSGGSYNRDRVEQFTACSDSIGELDLNKASNWNGWGNDLGSQRYQSSAGTGINKDNIAELEIAWSLGVEGASAARAQPAVIDGIVIMGSPSGQVYALNLESGCHYWTYAAISEVRAAPTVVHAEGIDKTVVIVADQSNRVYALDIQSGEKIWHADPDANPWAVSTGAPAIHDGKVFVPISSMEVAGAGNPQHVCCTFRGNVAALDLNSGEKLWQTYIMPEATEVGKNSVGNAILAPSGAPIWGSATFDVERNRVYVGSGQNYSRPTSDTSDSVIAFDADTGNMDWVYQSTANDAFTMGCSGRVEHPNCPDPGPDLDIGAPILLATLSSGQDILIAGTKGGVVFGLDPEKDGAVLWQVRVGRGSPLGGVHWGMTFLGDTVYVPVSDRIPGGTAPAQPGLHAIDMKTGEVLWYAQAPDHCDGGGFSCSNAYSGAATALDDLVVLGALNGYLFAHDKNTGEVIWELDTKVSYETANNVPASGGAIDATGPVFSGHYMLLNSGYAAFGQLAGNALIVYKLP
ncbi:MAG: PQQ-binding-like beta-propeller repeat protein [Pseudohongiella sp.]|nr:PQQ-binding-like beta-propeller repeat protein [Pseudohongiella sp.]